MVFHRQYHDPRYDDLDLDSGNLPEYDYTAQHHPVLDYMDQDDLRHSEPYHSQTAYTQPVSVEQAYPNAARHATYPAHIPTLNHQYERGANPRNAHGTKLKPVSVLPDLYRGFFKFGVFNAVQSRCYDAIMHTTKNMVINAPTGSGKTVLFELALIRLFTKEDPSQVKAVYMAPTKALCSERFRDWTTKFTSIGVNCCELTGDTVGDAKNALAEAKSSSIIITTPEKFDSLSRNWRDHGEVLSRTQLFLIDEVHILNETRGSILEVVVSRMKTRGKHVRFLLVSATVPNIDDVAVWIGNGSSSNDGPATVYSFGEEFRPCKLTRFVYGYPCKNQNEFSFNRMLDYKLLGLLQQHSADKPVLIFCATRKGVVGTAEVLAKEYQKLMVGKQNLPWSKPETMDLPFHDKQLRELAEFGIGVHHAGLNLEDRRVTEDLFLKKIISVMVATSTLAVGVNLPAHTVVIKGVKMWQNGEWQEYSDLDFVQMIGRAGRPQFDNEGVAVILCDTEQQRKYKAFISGQTLLESCLHHNLAEHLNSEIGLGTITDLSSAKEWLHNSFLFYRIQKNPRHYALNKGSDQTWQSRVDELVEVSIADLEKSQLISASERDGVNVLASTEFGEIMSRYYVRLDTMQSVLRLSDQATVHDILEVISSAGEIGDLRLRAGEKQMYRMLSEHNDIRFRTKVEKASDKVCLIIQAVLAGISLNSPEYKVSDSQPFLEALSVFKHAPRIARTIVEVAIARKAGGMLKNGMELVRSLTAKAWEDRPVVLRQIEQIGEKSIKVLAQNGITSLAALRGMKPARLEVLLNRRPPFGTAVIAAVQELPQFTIAIHEVSVSSSRGETYVMVELEIEVGLVPFETSKLGSKPQRKSGSLGMTAILTLTSDNHFVDFRRIPTRCLKQNRSFMVKVALEKPSQTVSIRISPDNFAGLTVVQTYKPSLPPSEYPTRDTRPAPFDVDEILAGLEEDPNFWDINTDDSDGIGNGGQSPSHLKKQRQTAASHLGPSIPSKQNSSKRAETVSTSKAIGKLTSTNMLPVSSGENVKLGSVRGGSVKLPNGNYSCNHTCKRKSQCKHICCREGLPHPPKKPPTNKAIAISEISKKSDRHDHGSLESLHSISGSAIPSNQRLALSFIKPSLNTENQVNDDASCVESDELASNSNNDLPDAHAIIQLAPQGKTKRRLSNSDILSSDSDAPPSYRKDVPGRKKLKPNLKATELGTPARTTMQLDSTVTPLTSTDQMSSFWNREPLRKQKTVQCVSIFEPNSPAEKLQVSDNQSPNRMQSTKANHFPLGTRSEDDYDEDVYNEEGFTLDLSLFDMEQTKLSSDPDEEVGKLDLSPSPGKRNALAALERSVNDEKIYSSAIKNDGGTLTELDVYEQGLAELNAWLCSGAVEIVDETEM